jgi:hypothetical protein
MDGLSVEVKLCRGDCSLVVSSDKFASPFTLAVEQTCASVAHHIYWTCSAGGLLLASCSSSKSFLLLHHY